jgi:hypothetical protein
VNPCRRQRSLRIDPLLRIRNCPEVSQTHHSGEVHAMVQFGGTCTKLMARCVLSPPAAQQATTCLKRTHDDCGRDAKSQAAKHGRLTRGIAIAGRPLLLVRLLRR